MAHQYINPAKWNAPFSAAAKYLSGLGDSFPAGRSYQSTAWFRAPYKNGYYQDNNLSGLGANIGAEMPSGVVLPGETSAYLRGSKEQEPSVLHDANIVVRQIPTWAVVASGLGLSLLAYNRHRRGK